MKFVVGNLRKGDVIEAEVVEIVSPTAVIVNFQGDLIRIVNQTGRILAVGERHAVRVVGTQPLSFQLVGSEWKARKIDVSV